MRMVAFLKAVDRRVKFLMKRLVRIVLNRGACGNSHHPKRRVEHLVIQHDVHVFVQLLIHVRCVSLGLRV